MRISRINNCAAFKQLQVRTKNPFYINESRIKACEKKLMDTKFVDVVLDSQDVAIKDKMTDFLYRIQSFSLFPLEKAVGIRMIGEKEPPFKFFYKSDEEAKSAWKELCKASNIPSLEKYTQVALWLEKHFNK